MVDHPGQYLEPNRAVAEGANGGYQIIVKYKDNLDFSVPNLNASTLGAEVASAVSGNVVAEIKTINSQVLEVDKDRFEKALASLNADPRVEFAEPDYIVSIALDKPEKVASPAFASSAQLQAASGPVESAFVPNDPRLGELWGMDKISAQAAWDVTRGDSNVIIGVIDTGIDYTHPDLAANMWVNPGEIPGNGLDDDGNGFVDDVHGYDFVNNDGDPMDDQGHGTHVAGTIGAVADNGIGVAGVMHDTQLMGLKFLDASGSGSMSNAIAAIDYATAMGVTLTNNSWGGGGYSQSLYTSIQNAGLAGQLFVAAAGNASNNNDGYASYPATYDLDNIISVASSTSSDSLSGFSNYGATTVDLAAPGSGILSTLPNDSYGSFSGTSMASPHVAGAVGLIYAANPTASSSEVKARLLDGVDPIAAFQGVVATGGRLNVLDAFSPPQQFDISGVIWNDQNGDGVQDAGEALLSDRTIFLDANKNGVLDTGEQNVITDASGAYSFTVNKGNYEVAQVLPEGWEQTAPDNITYATVTSADPEGPTYSWFDISSLGTDLSIADEERVAVELPWEFDFFGQALTTVYVNDNGFLTPDSILPDIGAGHFWQNTNIPNASVPNGMIAPYWDDLDPGVSGAVLYYHDAANERAIFQWDQVPYYANSSTSLTFQAVLNKNGEIEFFYEDVSQTRNSATIGIESPDNQTGVQLAYNNAYVTSGMAISAVQAKKGWSLGVYQESVDDAHFGTRQTVDEPNPPVETDFTLTLDTLVEQKFGNKFSGVKAPDGTVLGSFESDASQDLYLNFDGFDIDNNVEVGVLLNGTSLGNLRKGVNNGLASYSFDLPASAQVNGQNILTFEQLQNPVYRWGVTDLLLTDAPVINADFELTLNTIETGNYGHRFERKFDADGVVIGTFNADASTTLFLSFDGYDIDSDRELDVMLNGTKIADIEKGINNGMASYSIAVPASAQVDGENILEFKQMQNPKYKWGVTDILLGDTPVTDADFILSMNTLEEGRYGHRFSGVREPDGIVEGAFVADASTDLYLSLQGYDIDSIAEVGVFLNGTDIGNLGKGTNNGLASYTVELPASAQVDGLNEIEFKQLLNPRFKWGLTDVMLTEGDTTDSGYTLDLDPMAAGSYEQQSDGAFNLSGSTDPLINEIG